MEKNGASRTREGGRGCRQAAAGGGGVDERFDGRGCKGGARVRGAHGVEAMGVSGWEGSADDGGLAGVAADLFAFGGVFHEFDGVAVGVGEPGLDGVVHAGAEGGGGDAFGVEGFGEGFEGGDFEAEVAGAGADEGGEGGCGGLVFGAPLLMHELAVEDFDEGRVAGVEVVAEGFAGGVLESKLDGEAEGVGVEVGEAREVVGDEAEVGEFADHDWGPWERGTNVCHRGAEAQGTHREDME
jgi:hypothetical protein